MFDAPVEILDSDKPLGTHALIAAKGDAAELRWFALKVEGDDSAAVLTESPSPRQSAKPSSESSGPVLP